MAKEYTVDLGGKIRRLRFTHADSRAFYREFKKPMHELFFGDVLGIRDGVLGVAMNPAAQFAVLLAGLKNDFPNLNEQALDKWVADFLVGGGTMADLATECMRAACAAGVVNGRVFDFDEMVQGLVEDLGKAPMTNETETDLPPEPTES